MLEWAKQVGVVYYVAGALAFLFMSALFQWRDSGRGVLGSVIGVVWRVPL